MAEPLKEFTVTPDTAPRGPREVPNVLPHAGSAPRAPVEGACRWCSGSLDFEEGSTAAKVFEKTGMCKACQVAAGY